MISRLDIYIKEKLNISRQKAAEIIRSSNVRVNKKTVTKPSFSVNEYDDIEILNTDNVLKYVSRGGYKLEKAIESFGICLDGKICVDIGASTGGFTDCMLQYGADRVYACDVGNNQLAESIKNNVKVISIENTDIRNLNLEDKADFISCDVSFISLRHIIPKAKTLLKSDGSGVFLIKPQFEAGREFLNKNGIVKNPKIHKRVIKDIIYCLEENEMYAVAIDYSPIKGGDGNIEYIIYVNSTEKNTINIDFVVDEAFKKL